MKSIPKYQFLSLILLILFPWLGMSQSLNLLTALEEAVSETSGLVVLNDHIITHNDSGGAPALYEVDTLTGTVTRTVYLSNASNVDWEDICTDDDYLYIGDFGNNQGTRTDLKIYRLSVAAYLSSENDTVSVDTIHFNYADQTDFSPGPFSTNFDAEAFIAINDSLYIFTKNWGNFRSNVYVLPNQPGSYQAERIDSLDTQGLITGATFSPSTNTVVLSGHTFSNAFVIELMNFTTPLFSDGMVEKFPLAHPPGYAFQVEGIAALSPGFYLLSAEEGLSGSSALYSVNTDVDVGLDNPAFSYPVIYPNPAFGAIRVDYENFTFAKIFDTNGYLKLSTQSADINISALQAGCYYLVLYNELGYRVFTRQLIILP